jgi:hypothetical protein
MCLAPKLPWLIPRGSDRRARSTATSPSPATSNPMRFPATGVGDSSRLVFCAAAGACEWISLERLTREIPRGRCRRRRGIARQVFDIQLYLRLCHID